jgi:hypothetical protein
VVEWYTGSIYIVDDATSALDNCGLGGHEVTLASLNFCRLAI